MYFIHNLAVCNFVQGMIALFYAHPVDAAKIAGKIYPEPLTKRTPLRNVLQPEANSFTVHLFMIVRTVILFHGQPVGKNNLQLDMEILQFTTILQKGPACDGAWASCEAPREPGRPVVGREGIERGTVLPIPIRRGGHAADSPVHRPNLDNLTQTFNPPLHFDFP